MSAKGQVVVPAEVRHKLKLEPGAHLRLYESGAKVVLVPELVDPVGEGLGFVKRENACAREEERATGDQREA